MRVFEKTYSLYGRIQLESEKVELVLGDGRLRWQKEGGRVDHPVLLQRVEIEFDPHLSEFRINDTDRLPELYTSVLDEGDNLSPAQLSALRNELEKGGYHPLAPETSAYLRRLAQVLGPRGDFQEVFEESPIGSDPRVVRDVVLFLRPRPSGLPAAFDRVLQDLERCPEIPISLKRVAGIETERRPDGDDQPFSPWGEPPDILLSKPANPEQIEIARGLNRHDAVLVQGPPGTGKSHTIANLIGHLVAYGKRVLITSHTNKALRVLRGQLVESLQPLCVSVLENDLEGRQQMEQAVRGILSRLTTASERGLAEEVIALSKTRSNLIAEIDKISADIKAVREAEYQPVLVGGESYQPADGARWVQSNADGNDWIPGPLEPGAPMPLSASEVAEFYAAGGRVSEAEEREIAGGLPSMDVLPSPSDFAEDVAALGAVEPEDLAPFWERGAGEEEIDDLKELLRLLEQGSRSLDHFAPWQRAIVSAGHPGTADKEIWKSLESQIRECVQKWEKAKPALLDREVRLPSDIDGGDQRRITTEILVHLEGGGALNAWSLLFHGDWKRAVRAWRVNDSEPRTAPDFRAIGLELTLAEGRRRLAHKWSRLAVPVGLPTIQSLGSTPEQSLSEYGEQVGTLLDWWTSFWSAIDKAAGAAGFRWPAFRAREVARTSASSPFERDAAIAAGPYQTAVRSRLALAQRARSLRRLASLQDALAGKLGPVCCDIRDAARSGDSSLYAVAHAALKDLYGKATAHARRRELGNKLAASAGRWADAILNRSERHGTESPPGDASRAWKWRQLRQEIDRRAAMNEDELMRRLHQRRAELRDMTAQLIDRMAWLAQLRRIGLNEQQALQGWADTQRRIGKGTGKRVPALQAKARGLLVQARNAVPVWIMPLSRVAESFDPTQGRFDVVIIDEASQSDVMTLLAWYLGKQVVVVGDHEQVSPLAVGQELGLVQSLINEHLDGIPNNHLYDGRLSVYDLARASFGGMIALREHFRCVPDIIEFSNRLSYNGEIRPLRSEDSASRPHLVECVVDGSRSTSAKENLVEARYVASIVKALTEMEDYSGKTIGAISLLGEEQARRIQDLAGKVVDTVELNRRRFVAGIAGQYQGDERDIMLLSMVDAPTGTPLRFTDKDLSKQRFNVAASRARDQLWLIHSLDPGRDLKPGDLRRTLIEHFRDPSAKRRAVEIASRRAESPFERSIAERLIGAGFRVRPQVWVGHYRIDMVVSDGKRQVALECDGDRFHGFEQIPADMARQAVLERAGWAFIRVRSTRFYRDPEEAMAVVFDELRRLGIQPSGHEVPQLPSSSGAEELRERVLRRAWEVMREAGWLLSAQSDTGAASQLTLGT
jgi:very-short-patch-repair endonuclease